MRLQLWSCNYAPEPTGIGPVSAALARGLRDRGHEVEVVAGHPHYPEPRWGGRVLPYREVRDGIPVTRLPVWAGRDTAGQRIRQEASYAGALFAAVPFLGRPDLILAASPSFAALLPAVVASRLRRVPLVLWLHDVLPEGALATGQLGPGSPILRASRRLERTAYRRATKIVVLARPFLDNLRAKGVDPDKLAQISHPASLGVPVRPPERPPAGGPTVVSIGNIGHSQGLVPLAVAFGRNDELRALGARLVITGTGVAAAELERSADPRAVEMLGLLPAERLDAELRAASVALVSQRHTGTEFNLPSKLMNLMAYGLPIIAAVNPRSEVARIVEEAGAGWVVDSSDPDAFPVTLAAALRDPGAIEQRGAAAHLYAREHFSIEGFARRFDELLIGATRG